MHSTVLDLLFKKYHKIIYTMSQNGTLLQSMTHIRCCKSKNSVSVEKKIMSTFLTFAGLWRFSVRFSPFELADLAKPELRNLLNTAQDCVIYLKNQGQNKKKKG